MGGCPAKLSTVNPHPSNFCGVDDVLGMETDVNGSCFFDGSAHIFCNGVGDPSTGDVIGGSLQTCFGEFQGSTEWTNIGNGGPCGVCSNCDGVAVGSGDFSCPLPGCSWPGHKQRCRRDAFHGDPLTCCRRSVTKSDTDTTNVCFENGTKLKTCDPANRGFTNKGCVNPMATYCSDDTDGGIVNKWSGLPQDKDCLRFVQENPGDESQYGAVVGDMVNKYLLTENKPITSAASDGTNHDPFIDQIVKVCRLAPGACDEVLKQKCKDVTREQMGTNINLANLCGCFMDDDQYKKFASFGVDRICDPICTIGSTVKPANPSSPVTKKEFLKCSQSICVIDDVTIKLIGSAAGAVSFTQACGNCGVGNKDSSSCRCYISDTTVEAVNSLIKDVNFNQQCGNNSICSVTQPDGTQKEVDCGTGTPTSNSGGAGGTNDSTNASTYWIVLIILVIIGVMIIIVFIVRRSKPPRTTTQTSQLTQAPSSKPLVARGPRPPSYTRAPTTII